ncbi:TIR domain-containing protein [uncultured Akkermansia sp.]|jgi:hypothetical protein|uniref:TIR domain-containing protein n=1 Tax=uncultured Akkermansia sp. TaxID=512294 RepID=UPI0025F121C2|nr:TIR domain-containing protein [uncultured Akkermansia sp.]
MPILKNYRLFISHPWSATPEYERLVSLLDRANNFSWCNYSVPQVDPFEKGSDTILTESLKRQISSTHCVLILSGMYVCYRKWIQKEIDLALYFNKPIIGIKPWGQERTPYIVSCIAHEMVGWNTDSIVSAIRNNSL